MSEFAEKAMMYANLSIAGSNKNAQKEKKKKTERLGFASYPWCPDKFLHVGIRCEESPHGHQIRSGDNAKALSEVATKTIHDSTLRFPPDIRLVLVSIFSPANLWRKRLSTMSVPATATLGKDYDRDEKDIHPLDDQLAITSADVPYGKTLGAAEENQARG